MNDEEDYMTHANRVTLPMMKQSHFCISLLDEKIDAKLCVEIGAAILYEKPIIIIARPGAIISPAMERIADKIIEITDLNDPIEKKKVEQAIDEVMALHFPQQISEEKG